MTDKLYACGNCGSPTIFEDRCAFCRGTSRIGSAGPAAQAPAKIRERARARRTDPKTSHDAANSVRLTENQLAVLTVFRLIGAPMLDERLVALYKMYERPHQLPRQSESGIRSRRAELARAERLVEGEKTKMSTGRMGRTWQLAPPPNPGGIAGAVMDGSYDTPYG